VVVLKSKRGQGIGSVLIEEALNKIQNAGIKKVFLEVRENNLPAIGAYKKFGFNQISVRKKYYLDGENALVMLKEF
jgi:ribosomal-protein-alanine N-acetyltransferase